METALNSAYEDCVIPLPFELPTPSTPLYDVTKTFWFRKINLFSVLISVTGQSERDVERAREGGGRGEKGATYESVTVQRSPINHPVYTTHYLPGGPLF